MYSYMQWNKYNNIKYCKYDYENWVGQLCLKYVLEADTNDVHTMNPELEFVSKHLLFKNHVKPYVFFASWFFQFGPLDNVKSRICMFSSNVDSTYRQFFGKKWHVLNDLKGQIFVAEHCVALVDGCSEELVLASRATRQLQWVNQMPNDV